MTWARGIRRVFETFCESDFLRGYLPTVLGGVWLGRGRGVGVDGRGKGGLISTFACFDCCCRALILGGGTGRWAMSAPKFGIFLIFPYFLGS